MGQRKKQQEQIYATMDAVVAAAAYLQHLAIAVATDPQHASANTRAAYTEMMAALRKMTATL